MQRRRRRGHGRAAALVAAVVLVATAQGAAAAAPHEPAPAAGRFSSSFEPGDPQPAWRNTVETDAAGAKRASGIDGTVTTGIPGNVTDKVTDVRANGEYEASGEVKENLVDGEVSSKWLVFENTGWVEFDLEDPVAVVRYALSSANDEPGRDPRDWKLQGSKDGKDWTTLDTREGQSFEERFQTKEYSFDNSTAYQHYRLEITRNAGDGILQLAEVQFSDGNTAPPAPSDMRSFVHRGPSGSPTAKSNAGFTGLHALQYAGTHKPDGRAYSYNKVFDVDVKVTARTRLSYMIFPQMPETDLKYPATYTSLDLAFTDGTYLSDLRAVDQQGARLSPQGQGASKTLYVNQWNHKESAIGAVAAGRTVDRVLVAYDAPKGPAKFRGWVDDIDIGPAPQEKPSAHLSDYASTVRGTNSTGNFSRGNNFPATAVPNGFNFWSPMTNSASTSWLYDYARANNDKNLPTLQAFTASHEPSPWMGDRQTFQVMPSSAAGTPDASRKARALPFRHENETAKPHYYGVTFENGLRTEIAPADHAAMMRFTFPGDDASVIFDNVNDKGGLTLDAEHGTFTGYSDVKSGLSTGATRLFVHGVFDAPVTDSGKLKGGGGDNVTGFFRFRTGADRTVHLRIATSLIGTDQAKANLEQEIPQSASFSSVEARARDAWDGILGRIEVEGATRDQLTTLYSNLYRLYLYPNSGFEKTDEGIRYASPFSAPTGENTPTRTGAKIVDGKVYVNNGFWDTYRTTWPAYSFLTPKRAGEMVDGFVQQFKDGGWMSRWSSPGYADLMTGTSSDVAFADSYLKGVDFDAEAAYRAALKNATVAPPNSGVGRKGMETSVFLGYTGTGTREGMSWALEGYLNDFGIAQMAKKLYQRTGKRQYKEEGDYFLGRARNYVNLYDPSIGFFQGKDASGKWRLPADKYDPRVWGYDYTETNGWNMAFTAPQDGRGLANLYGGKDKLAKKLDTFFSTPETASPDFAGSYGGIIHEMTEARDVRMGMYGHSNQPSHHIPYMYDAAGQPSKTQALVREAVSRLYAGSEIGQGYAGDEDNGEMSAWYVFSSLGFYPLVMGSPEYAVGSPLFRKATVHLENGRDLVVRAARNSASNVYVQGLEVNGRRWNSTALPHALLARGGTLEFAMGPRPSHWGTGRDSAPTSITKGDEVPSPLADVTTADTETTSSAGDAKALVDNTSATATSVEWAQVKLDGKSRPRMYTLTSMDASKAPSGWVLKGSDDGEKWKVLDTRSDQSFSWNQQTRVFGIGHPGRYTHYRLELTGGPASLAEFELLS
ncbi:GH92 family glycosyl hydrolase [Wenjunlia tyrosinilytica]|uniref:Alpha-1 2-mannosidase n=1 Tax=Wenjunlia tyrosinilytica TaxID=1544741 RepID=A0A918DSA3_9ACTN|nr:GH92 family glycosyl hydrolase [Wenjunlia tyrosinilytica]GGO80084.1 alpha-1 2-mannosidase [Wenjunlia tyrosinilytica]